MKEHCQRSVQKGSSRWKQEKRLILRGEGDAGKTIRKKEELRLVVKGKNRGRNFSKKSGEERVLGILKRGGFLESRNTTRPPKKWD